MRQVSPTKSGQTLLVELSRKSKPNMSETWSDMVWSGLIHVRLMNLAISGFQRCCLKSGTQPLRCWCCPAVLGLIVINTNTSWRCPETDSIECTWRQHCRSRDSAPTTWSRWLQQLLQQPAVLNPLTPTGTAIKHPVPDRVKRSFVIFDVRALWRSSYVFHISTMGVKRLTSWHHRLTIHSSNSSLPRVDFVHDLQSSNILSVCASSS